MTLQETIATANSKDATYAIINSINIISYGFVTEVIGPGIARVAFSIKDGGETVLAPCTVLNYKTKNINIDFDISVGDKLLLFVLKNFNKEMFASDTSLLAERKTSYALTNLIGIPFGMNSNKSKLDVSFTPEGVKTIYYKAPSEEGGEFEEALVEATITDENINLIAFENVFEIAKESLNIDIAGNTLVMNKSKTIIGGNLEVSV